MVDTIDQGEEEKYNTLNIELSEDNSNPSSAGKIITSRYIYEKYDRNLNNRPDYEFEKTLSYMPCLHYTILTIIMLFVIIFLCTPDMGGNLKYNNMKIIGIIIAIILFVQLTLIPYSVKYKISFSKRLFTYQYMSFIPNIFLRKQNIINIEDANYFREDLSLKIGSFPPSSYNFKLMKMNKNNEEVEIINFGKFWPVISDKNKRSLYAIQKMARLLNEIIGFDINLIKKIKKAYSNQDNIALQKIGEEMGSDKKALFQNLFNKMGINIKLL